MRHLMPEIRAAIASENTYDRVIAMLERKRSSDAGVVFVWNNRLQRGDQRSEPVADHMPHHLKADVGITVDQPMAHPDNLSPRDI